MPAHRLVLLVQATFYIVTGLWSLASRSSFERVTGPKTDYWLVRMVGLLATVIGLALVTAVWQTAVENAVWVLAIGSAVAFGVIDVWYAIPRRISRIYLADAVFEFVLVIGLAVSWYASRLAV
jgi:UDP-N-acetylmuramyl pentapeptide phosphotransferase/UDP-N-acetylglucosamine-1-phosphate transferase